MSSVKDNKIRKRKEFVYTGISIIVVILLTFILSYKSFSKIIMDEGASILKTRDLAVEFSDNEVGLGNIISLNKKKEITNTPYVFNIKNTSSQAVEYIIKIIDDYDMILEDGCYENLLSKELIKYSINNGESKTLSNVESDGFIIYRGNIKSGDSIKYNINVFINDADKAKISNEHYHGKIIIEQKKN